MENLCVVCYKPGLDFDCIENFPQLMETLGEKLSYEGNAWTPQ